MKTKEFNHTFENPFFVATVTDNNDPTFNYRIKVRIDHLHDAVADENLPWAAKVDSSFMGMSDSADLSHKIPEVGSRVLVLAVANDPNSLLYLGCLYRNTPQTPSGDDYINTYGIYTKKGEFIGIEKIKNIFHMIWKGDLILDVEGKIKLGSNAIQKAVLGDDLERLLNNMIGVFNSHTHTGNLGVPTLPSQTPMVFSKVTSDKITLE
jgi:hypothetical protein